MLKFFYYIFLLLEVFAMNFSYSFKVKSAIRIIVK